MHLNKRLHVQLTSIFVLCIENNNIIIFYLQLSSSDHYHQPEPPAVAIVRQNGRSSASCRASVAVTPASRQIWWVQVVDGRPQARLHSCENSKYTT